MSKLAPIAHNCTVQVALSRFDKRVKVEVCCIPMRSIAFKLACIPHGALKHPLSVETSFAKGNTSWPWKEQTQDVAMFGVDAILKGC
jgi:hypothetical protein